MPHLVECCVTVVSPYSLMNGRNITTRNMATFLQKSDEGTYIHMCMCVFNVYMLPSYVHHM